jgi:serine/threonine-protein kinase
MIDRNDPIWRRWPEIDRIFEAALDLPPADRPAYVDQTCGEDGALRESVLGLLEAAGDSADLFGPSSVVLRAALTGPEPATGGGARLDRGEVVGSWRITGELGRGGMATVYEAERADGAFEQRVAIKVLDRGPESGDVVARFLSERQILSGLEHPNIARLLDGGTTSEGRPYLVMEKVEGEPVTKWADARSLSLRGRLDLFRQIAEAVGYAHARLIVHRDLKPANVMVGGDGRVRLLDFGIAKLLDSPENDQATAPAMTLWMTPQYAAPEQILGRPVTTATDVHGLGVVLYELLSGHRPFGGDLLGGFELQKSICEEAPDRPSTVVKRTVERTARSQVAITPRAVAAARSTDPVALRRELDGDLDAIVLKALRKEPEARYATVQALLDDIERYVTGFPIRAHTGAWAYRARKFVKRNWLATSAAAAIVVILAGSSVLLSIEQRQTTIERDRATRQATNAQLVIDFLGDVFRGQHPDQAPADTITARELLAWGTERIDTAFADRPDVQAELLSVMGRAHQNLGLLDESVALHERSVAMRREVYGDSSPEVADGLASLANAHSENRDFARVLPVREEILAIRRTAHGPQSIEVADALRGVALTERELGLLDRAESRLRESMSIRERSGTTDESAAVDDMLGLAYLLRAQDRLDEAEALYEEAIPRYRALHGPRDPELAGYLNNLAYLHRVREDYTGAEPLYREAIELSTDLYGRGHPSTMMFASNLATVMERLGRYEEEYSLLRRNVDVALEQWPEGHWRIGSAWNSYGTTLLRTGRTADARAPLEAAIREYNRTIGADHYWTNFANADLAVYLILTGEEDRGREYLDGFYGRLKSYHDENDGLMSQGTLLQLEPFIALLSAANLSGELARFGALISREESE